MRRLAIVLLVLGACTPGSSTPTASSPAVVTSAPATTTPAPSATITVPPTTTSTTIPPRPELSEPQVIYLLMDASVGTRRLAPVWRDATSPQGVAGAIETLLAGPTPTERLGVPAISTAIPATTQLLGVGVVNGLATIDLSADFFEDPSSERLAQVIYTATRFEEVDSVLLRIDGEPFAGMPSAVGRLAFRELQPSVFIEEPAYGAPAAQPGRLVGEAQLVAGAFRVRITDGEGLTVADRDVAAAGTGWVGFNVPLPYWVDVEAPGLLHVATDDGVMNASYPVQLLLPPTGTCSAVGLSPDIEPQGLPEPVEATRAALVAAAVNCDLEELASLAAPDFTYSFGAAGPGAALFWESEERLGVPFTRLLVQLLDTPAVLDTYFVVPTYLWPAAFGATPTPEDFDLLEGIISAEDLELYRQFNDYLDLRIGIAADGAWDFAVAGD
jgi:hypothetical protein